MPLSRPLTFALASFALAGSAHALDVTSAGLVVLNQTANGALSMTGNSLIEVPSAAVYVNSASVQAVQTVGTALLSTPDLFIVGQASFGGKSSCSGTVHQAAASYVNPLQGFAAPSSAGLPSFDIDTINSNAVVTLQPGRYTDELRVTGNATITFAPGVYYFEDGLRITAGSVSGVGVTLILVHGSLEISGTSSLSLSPPSSGITAGMVMAVDSDNCNGITLAGGSTVNISGTIYAPSSLVTLTGNSSIVGQGPIMGDLVVADRVRLTGTGSVKIGHPGNPAIVLPTMPLYD
jgi:hypothetical protein